MAVRFLLDENLSERLVASLSVRFPDALHIRVLGLGGAPDLRLWEVAARERCLLVTKDEDFVQLSVVRGPPPRVLFVAHPELAFLALGLGPRAS